MWISFFCKPKKAEMSSGHKIATRPDLARPTRHFDPTRHVYFYYCQCQVTKKSRPDPMTRPF
eukprot:UN00344